MAERGRTWTDDEIKALLEIWGFSDSEAAEGFDEEHGGF